MAFPLFVLAMGIVAALGNSVENIIYATAIVNVPFYARMARAEVNVRRERRLRRGGAGERQRRAAHPARAYPAQHHAASGRADVAHHGLGDAERGRPVLHRARRPSADAGMGHHGRRGRAASSSRANGGSRCFPALRWCSRCSASTCSATGCATWSIRGAKDVEHAAMPLLEVRRLSVEFRTRRGMVQALKHVSFAVAQGRERWASSAKAAPANPSPPTPSCGILDRAGRITAARPFSRHRPVRTRRRRAMRDLRGREISMVFQNPRAALNPIRKVGDQIEDVLRATRPGGPASAREKAIEALEQVRIRDPERRTRLSLRASGRHVPARR